MPVSKTEAATRITVSLAECPDDGGKYAVIDEKHGAILQWGDKRIAESFAAFFRKYLRKWGDIDLTRAPMNIDEPFVAQNEDGDHPKDAPMLRGHGAAIAGQTLGQFLTRNCGRQI